MKNPDKLDDPVDKRCDVCGEPRSAHVGGRCPHDPDCEFQDYSLICSRCGKRNGNHSAEGGYCPTPDGSGFTRMVFSHGVNLRTWRPS